MLTLTSCSAKYQVALMVTVFHGSHCPVSRGVAHLYSQNGVNAAMFSKEGDWW